MYRIYGYVNAAAFNVRAEGDEHWFTQKLRARIRALGEMAGGPTDMAQMVWALRHEVALTASGVATLKKVAEDYAAIDGLTLKQALAV